MTMVKQFKLAKQIFTKAVNSVFADNLIKNLVIAPGVFRFYAEEYDLNSYKNVYVLGFGKAAGEMARAFETFSHLENIKGAVIVPSNYGDKKLRQIKLLHGSHPVPNKLTFDSSKVLLRYMEDAGEKDFVVALISGGASSLFELPVDELSFSDISFLYEKLLLSGAPIQDINRIRQFFSKFKGGGLLNYIYPANGFSIIISDVLGDPLDFIASGPTVVVNKDPFVVEKLMKEYDIYNKSPEGITRYLDSKKLHFSYKSDDNVNCESVNEDKVNNKELVKKNTIVNRAKFNNHIIGSNEIAIKNAEYKARELGYDVRRFQTKILGEARICGKKLISEFKSVLLNNKIKKSLCFISGGETTVTIKGSGKGGRNQELVLSALKELIKIKEELPKERKFIFMSAGTDGIDGYSDVAGAYITNASLAKVEKNKLNIEEFLNNNDSYSFFQKINTTFKTGATGTNVMDLVIALVD